ncbi:MAG: PIN domain-containing protein [Kiritimatiellia bacterium]|nr:PIN domain-containing protein [Kiritimatiellia bacterium]
MKLPSLLHGGHDVVLDTMIFIYLFEDDQKYGRCCEWLLQQAADGAFTGVITPVTAAELLVKPLQSKRTALADHYRDALRGLPNIRLVDISPEAGFMAGALRAKYNLPLPDMIQAATAIEINSTALISNDKAMKRIKEVNVILLDSLI